MDPGRGHRDGRARGDEPCFGGVLAGTGVHGEGEGFVGRDAELAVRGAHAEAEAFELWVGAKG